MWIQLRNLTSRWGDVSGAHFTPSFTMWIQMGNLTTMWGVSQVHQPTLWIQLGNLTSSQWLGGGCLRCRSVGLSSLISKPDCHSSAPSLCFLSHSTLHITSALFCIFLSFLSFLVDYKLCYLSVFLFSVFYIHTSTLHSFVLFRKKRNDSMAWIPLLLFLCALSRCFIKTFPLVPPSSFQPFFSILVPILFFHCSWV